MARLCPCLPACPTPLSGRAARRTATGGTWAAAAATTGEGGAAAAAAMRRRATTRRATRCRTATACTRRNSRWAASLSFRRSLAMPRKATTHRATTGPNRTRSRTEHPSRRATREAASRSHKTRRVTPSPPTRKRTPATAAPMTMGRHTWPTTTARQHRSRGRTCRARERLSLPHPLSCLLHHWPAVLRDNSGHVGDDDRLRHHTHQRNAPECRPHFLRIHAPTPHEIQTLPLHHASDLAEAPYTERC
mmetsp:Transcript_13446/g.31841  ORF Transcript_13446/g.31841 Transcript_13446/m.31841 type:complete len:248 (-) Transcript_13446:252-995(-)